MKLESQGRKRDRSIRFPRTIEKATEYMINQRQHTGTLHGLERTYSWDNKKKEFKEVEYVER